MKIKVPNMNCNNCVAKIQMQLLPKGVNAKFDIDNHTVEVKESEYDTAVTGITNAGYKVEE